MNFDILQSSVYSPSNLIILTGLPVEVCFAIRIFQSGLLFALLTLVKRASTPWCLIFNLRLSFPMHGNRERSTWDAAKMPQIAPLNWALPVAPLHHRDGFVSIWSTFIVSTSRWYIIRRIFWWNYLYTLAKCEYLERNLYSYPEMQQWNTVKNWKTKLQSNELIFYSILIMQTFSHKWKNNSQRRSIKIIRPWKFRTNLKIIKFPRTRNLWKRDLMKRNTSRKGIRWHSWYLSKEIRRGRRKFHGNRPATYLSYR